MKKFVLLVASFLFFNSGTALADHHEYKQKKLIENERITVFIATLPPGAESPSVARELDRVVYAVKGGTIQRNYADGSTALYTYKTGDAVYADQPQDKQKYSIKNIGNSTVILQVTHLK